MAQFPSANFVVVGVGGVAVVVVVVVAVTNTTFAAAIRGTKTIALFGLQLRLVQKETINQTH